MMPNKIESAMTVCSCIIFIIGVAVIIRLIIDLIMEWSWVSHWAGFLTKKQESGKQEMIRKEEIYYENHYENLFYPVRAVGVADCAHDER